MTAILGKRKWNEIREDNGTRGDSCLEAEGFTSEWKRRQTEGFAPETRGPRDVREDEARDQSTSKCKDCRCAKQVQHCGAFETRGHRYKHTSAKGQARVQYGDQYFNVAGDCYLDTHSLVPHHHQEPGTRTLSQLQAKDMQTSNASTLASLLKILAEMLQDTTPVQSDNVNAEVLLRNLLDRIVPSEIPKQVHENVAYFEDAFGQRCRIDVDFVTDWTAFDFVLQRKFKTRGQRKIQDGNYFLQDVTALQRIGQRNRPQFRQLFRVGANISMSIYFDWEEVRHNSCPRCRSEEDYAAGVETICRTCKFAYTPGVVKEVEGEISNGSETPTKVSRDAQPSSVSTSVPIDNDPDRPEHFNRVSIGVEAVEEVVPVEPPSEPEILESLGYAQPAISSTSGSKRHKCPYCSLDFTRYHNLKSHLLEHSQEKPHACRTCEARFRRLHDLRRHEKLHTREKPHTCQHCGRKFAREDALARHISPDGGCAGRRSLFLTEQTTDESRDSLEAIVPLAQQQYGTEPITTSPSSISYPRPASMPLQRQQSGYFDRIESERSAPSNPLLGVSHDIYDLTDADNNFSIMPPPSFVYNSPSPAASLNQNGNTSPDNTGYDAFDDPNYSDQDWLALPLDPIINMNGFNREVDVSQGQFGLDVGGMDMLEMLLNGNNVNH